jgi:hypothetical protein
MYGSEDANEEAEKDNKESIMKKFDEFDDDMEEARKNFEESNGYPVGDDFLFAFGNDVPGEPDCISVTPKSYWDSEQCCYDDHISDILITMPDGFDETSECSFEYVDDDYNPLSSVEAIDALVKAGLKFNKDFQDFIDNYYNKKFRVNGMSIYQYILKNYPNSII